MLTFLAPAWLFGFALLPLIRWLHRPERSPHQLAVSRVALWRETAASRDAGRDRRPPDPAWRRRALLAALLFTALAGPQVASDRQSVTLWVDDSLSMLTREARATRLAEGFAQARSLLAEYPGVDLQVRTLGRPWRAFDDLADSTYAAIAADAGGMQAAAPPATLLLPGRRHWLITDGAHPTLLDWDAGTRPERLIRVGTVARNVGVERLSVRRNLNDPNRYDVLLKITNGGSVPEAREVVLSTEKDASERSKVELAPAATVIVRATMPASMRIVALLQPPDALPDDDSLAIDLGPLRKRPVSVDPSCPNALAMAVAAHPALSIAAGTEPADALLECGGRALATDVPVLRVRVDRIPAAAQGAARWSASIPESRRIRFDSGRLRVAAHLDAAASDNVVLALGDEPVIVRRGGLARIVETSLDFTLPEALTDRATPLLAALLFDELLGDDLLDTVVVAERRAGSATVVPAPVGDAIALSTTALASARSALPSERPLLICALLVLVWELTALARRWRRLEVAPRTDSP